MKPNPTLVVALDYTGCAWEVADMAADLAARLGATVMLTYVVHVPEGVPPELELNDPGHHKSEALLDEDAKRELDDIAQLFADKGVATRVDLRHGRDIVHEVLAGAKAHDADFLVMGTHGRTGLKRLVLGSVAERVIREATCPVITVRTKDPAAHPGLTDAQLAVAAEADG